MTREYIATPEKTQSTMLDILEYLVAPIGPQSAHPSLWRTKGADESPIHLSTLSGSVPYAGLHINAKFHMLVRPLLG